MKNMMRILALSVACLTTAQAATAVTTGSVNLRRSPGVSGRVLSVVPKGTLLIVACRGQWCRTTVGGQGGYVSRALTRPVSASAPLAGRGVVYFRSCAAVRAAGRAPLRLGVLGYRTTLDRNHNGLACERGE